MPFPLQQWQHVAFVADGSVVHLYRNGIQVAASPCDGVYKVPPLKHLTIGCQNVAESSDPPDVVKPDRVLAGQHRRTGDFSSRPVGRANSATFQGREKEVQRQADQ